MEKILQQILEGQAQINKRLDSFENRFDVLESHFDTLENRVLNIGGQLDENTQLIKALLHRTDELDAKFEGLLHTTATKDSIASLNSKFDLLNDRLFQTENKINLLSLAK